MADYILDPGVPGGQANMVPATFLSRTAQETIKAGQVVQNGSEDGTCLAGFGSPTPAAADMLGIATNDAEEGDEVRVATHGCFWVEVAGAVAPGDAVKIDAASTGKFGTTGARTLTDAKWDSTTTGAGLAIVRLNGFTAS